MAPGPQHGTQPRPSGLALRLRPHPRRLGLPEHRASVQPRPRRHHQGRPGPHRPGRLRLRPLQGTLRRRRPTRPARTLARRKLSPPAPLLRPLVHRQNPHRNPARQVRPRRVYPAHPRPRPRGANRGFQQRRSRPQIHPVPIPLSAPENLSALRDSLKIRIHHSPGDTAKLTFSPTFKLEPSAVDPQALEKRRREIHWAREEAELDRQNKVLGLPPKMFWTASVVATFFAVVSGLPYLFRHTRPP